MLHQRNKFMTLFSVVVGFAFSAVVLAQDSSIYRHDVPVAGQRPLTLSDGSWIRPQPIQLHEIKLHDIVSIRVEELARVQSDGEVDRRKTAQYNGVILDWLRLNGLRKAEPLEEDKRIRAQLDQLYRAEGELETSERLTFNIAARVVDIRPNGNIVLEAHKEVRVNEEIWRASLTGICRQQDIGPDNVILSRNIVDMRIYKQEVGHVRDGYRRGWLMKLLDRFDPF